MPALVVAGGICGLGALPAHALELGEVSVDSTLGQPLRASIAYALNANEQLHGYCISLRSGPQGGNAPAFNDARISVTGNRIQVSGNAAIREPLLNMQVVVDCAYTPRLAREYVLFIDPVITNVATQSMLAGNANTGTSVQPATATPTVSRRSASPAIEKPFVDLLPVVTSPIVTNSTYRVQTHDTVSTIVARINDREIALWPAVNMIFAANPDAFVNQDVNRLIAGSELFIPDLSGVATAVPGDSMTLPVSDIDEPLGAAELVEIIPTLTEPPSAVDDGISAGVVEEVGAAEETSTIADTPVINEEFVVEDQTAVLRPGDVVMPTAGITQPEAATLDATVGSGPVSVPVVSSSTSGTSGAWGWLLWLAGTGIALILGLFLFGRKIKDRIGAPRAAMPTPVEADQRPSVVADVDFEFEDTINAEAISLDADLGAGTGLNSGAQIDVAEDFGFSANGETESDLDMEITEGAAREPEDSPTDIIAPHHREEEPSILDSEEQSIDDDEYDLSMIVDATKQPLDQFDATAKDLQAVQIDQPVLSDNNIDYTVNSEMGSQALEQDYQEEFTATQAANAEIERVAMELSNRMDEEDDAFDVTREMPVTEPATDELSDKDLTAELQSPEISDETPNLELPTVSDSGITAELTANLPTSIEAENDPDINGEGLDVPLEMSAGSDITVEMNVQSGKVDTKKK